MAYIKLDEKKFKDWRRSARMFQDDIVCAIGTDFMEKIAEAENAMIFDILSSLESEATADVVEVKHGAWILLCVPVVKHLHHSKRRKHTTLFCARNIARIAVQKWILQKMQQPRKGANRMAELKPCPFCGGKACIDTHSFYDERTKGYDDHTYGVICENCSAQTAQIYLTKAQAKRAWNTRTPQKEG